MVEVLLVTGSTRHGSTNTAALRTAREVAPDGVAALLYEALAELPAFNPDQDTDPLPAPVADLRGQLASADAVLFCTPEFAGTLPGSFKNLLDWTVGGSAIYRKPVAWINVAAQGRGEGAADTLATVLTYLGTDIIRSACVRLTVARDAVGPDGTIADPQIRAALAEVLRTITNHVGS
ncbi:NADPH-dependent FMN reductase [Saccharopolyspora sp. 5N708]|uniref:NADPH-dependent FMN reductase n=1 Tax=Saccharopolyspora sp. 5N708 TaxID=3457424 RepID=UPI003FD4C71F